MANIARVFFISSQLNPVPLMFPSWKQPSRLTDQTELQRVDTTRASNSSPEWKWNFLEIRITAKALEVSFSSLEKPHKNLHCIFSDFTSLDRFLILLEKLIWISYNSSYKLICAQMWCETLAWPSQPSRQLLKVPETVANCCISNTSQQDSSITLQWSFKSSENSIFLIFFPDSPENFSLPVFLSISCFFSEIQVSICIVSRFFANEKVYIFCGS